MSLKFLILNTDYPEFLRWLYGQHSGLEQQSYAEQMRIRNESLFGVADFYSSNLCALGHEAYDVHANNEFMQKAWARAHGIHVEELTPGWARWREALQHARYVAARTPLRHLKPYLRAFLPYLDCPQTWFYDILAAQIKHYKPDVLLSHDLASISHRFLQEMKPSIRLLVGQIASPLPEREALRGYDLVISSLPNFIDHFRHMGLPAELQRFAFEPRVLNVLNGGGRRASVSFVGSLSWHHESRVRLLEHLSPRLDLHVWGQGIENLPSNSPVRQRYRGPAWGITMYQILRHSKVVVNHHIGVAEAYANNMRLFETTGVGTLLITDWKVNLHEMFEPGKEVVVYRTHEECAELIQYYLEHDDEREAIAQAGQERTLRDHTYYQRMQELAQVVCQYI